MQYKFYGTSEKAWTAMLEHMAGAKESIFIEMYILLDDDKKFDFIRVLKEKAATGIQVKIILDYLGSFGLPNNVVHELRAARAEVFFFSYFWHRLHRKIIIIDGTTVFLGGVNMHQSAAKWNDLMVMMRSNNFSRTLLRSFARSYFLAGGKDASMKKFINLTIRRKIKMWFIDHSPARKRYELKKFYEEKISTAKKSVVMVTPYFAPKRWLVALLDQATLRGVRVEICMPATTDSWFIDRANYFYIFKMSKTGAHFFLAEKMNHAKAMLVDDTEGIIGSQNVDSLSFSSNAESAIVFRDKKMLADLSQIINDWKQQSVPFEYKKYRPKWFDFILAPLIKISEPFL